jgi:zinc protease
VRELEIATEVRIFVGPFRDPGLVEIYASARGEHTAEELLAAIDEELTRAQSEPIASEEIERARARLELGLLAGLETVDGKASTIGFYETVLGRPAAAFERMEVTARLTASDLLRVARRYLRKEARSIVRVRAQMDSEAEAAE